MRKLMIMLFMAMFMVSMNSAVLAQEDVDTTTPSPEGAQNDAAPEPELINESGEDGEPEVIAVEEKTFVIYTEDSCPHCQNVKDFVTANDLDSEVEYIDITNNDENYDQLKSEWDRLGLDEVGWPFMLYAVNGEEDYAVGDDPIIDVLVEEFDLEEPVVEEESDNTLLLILGGGFFVAIIGYGIYSFVTKKDE